MKEKEKFVYNITKNALDITTKAIPVISEIGGFINSIIDKVYNEV